MTRSGKLVMVLLSAVMLAGCQSSGQPEVTTSSTGEATPSCPDGLSAALEEHLLSVPIGGVLPQEVNVDEFPDDFVMASSLVESMSGCVFATRIAFATGEVQVQIFGISDISEAAIITELDEAGWEQPDFGTGPNSVWETPDHSESVMLYVGGVSPQPALDFVEWARYLDPEQVLLLTNLAF